MSRCEDCVFSENCEIREQLIELESEYGLKLQVNYCPEFRYEQRVEDDPDFFERLEER